MRIFLVPLSRRTHALHCHSTLAKPSTSYLNRATVFASKKWEGLAQAKPDSMKRKLYSAGTTMLEKIEHRETFFKEVPAKEDVTITTMVRVILFCLFALYAISTWTMHCRMLILLKRKGLQQVLVLALCQLSEKDSERTSCQDR